MGEYGDQGLARPSARRRFYDPGYSGGAYGGAAGFAYPEIDGDDYLLWLRGEDGNGNDPTDSSNYKNTVSLNVDCTTSTAQAWDGTGSIRNDGTDDYLSLSGIAAYDLEGMDWTIEFWHRPDAGSGSYGLFELLVDSQQWIRVYVESGVYKFALEGDISATPITTIITGQTVEAATWQHLRVSWDDTAGEGKFFVDGVQQTGGNATFAGRDAGEWDFSGGDVSVGYDTALGEMSAGYLDEVLIIANHALGAGVPTSPVTGPTQVAPTASSVTVTGTPQVGVELTGGYTYADANNDPEGTSTFQWYRADDDEGTNEEAISGATSQNYTPVEADEGKVLRLGVTPVATVAPTDGDEAFSAYTAEVAAASWAPTDLTGLVGWFDATDAGSITESSGLVSQWDDLSGNDNHLTQGVGSSQPTTGVETINSLNALGFDGGNDWLSDSGAMFAGTISAATVYIVMKHLGLNNGIIVSLKEGAATAQRWQAHCPYGDGNIYFDVAGQGVGQRLSGASGLSINDEAIWGFICQPGYQAIRKNGAAFASDADGQSVPAGTVSIGKSGLNYQDCAIGEVIIVGASTTSDDRDAIEAYLLAKWGI